MFLSTVAMLKVLSTTTFSASESSSSPNRCQPFEDISPMKQGDFPASDVSFLEGKS